MVNKRLIALIAALILSVAGISFYGGPVTWTFFWIVLLIPVTMLIYIGCVIFCIKIYQRTDGRDMVAGEPSDFYITLTNESFFSFSSLRLIFYSSFSTIADIKDDLVYELPPRSSLVRKTRLICRYRGEYEVGLKKIVVSDPLGLFSVTWHIWEPLNVIVAPAIIRLSSLTGTDSFEEASRNDPALKTEPDIPVREYISGDDIRFIHWKASAVMQKLMIRERTGEEKNGICIIMDPMRHGEKPEEYLPLENRMIELVLALSLYHSERNTPVDAVTMGSGIQLHNVRDTSDFERLYEYLRGYYFLENEEDSGRPRRFIQTGKTSSDPGNSGVEQLLSGLSESGTMAGYRMLIIIMHEWSPETAALLEEINMERIPVRVFLVGTDDEKLQSFGRSEDRDRRLELIRIGTAPEEFI